jgi:CBS domain-containing protein
MTNTHDHACCYQVYRGRGERDLQAGAPEPAERAPPCEAPSADLASIRTIMVRELVCARPDLEIAAVVGLIMRHHVGCIPVVDERRRPIGVITKLDLVEHLDAAMRSAGDGAPLPSDLIPRCADDVMMPFALTLDEHATVAHAAAMMTSEDTHHVLVTDRDGRLIGVVSAKDIVRWVEQQSAGA